MTPRGSLSWADRLVEAGVLFLLIFTPLAYGTVEPWSEAIAELLILGMVAAWIVGMLSRWELRIELPSGWLPATLFLALVLVQAMPLPSALVELISPRALSLHQTAARYAGADPGFAPLSLASHETWREALKLVAVSALFLVGYNTYRTRGQVRRALWTMILMGTLISLFGIIQRMTWNGRFYWFGPEAPHASAFGPFVNRAHFAGLMVIVVPMALAFLLAGRRGPERKRLAQGWMDRLRQWNSAESGPTRLIPFLILLMGGAALVSGSRGGVVTLMGALLVMVGLGARSGRGWAARVAMAAVLIVLAGVWIGGDILYGTIERLAEEVGRPDESARVRIWRDAIGLWQGAPLFGTGLASFESAYPLVRTIQTPVVYGHAESDWVQLLTDTGLVGLGLALATAVTLMLALLRAYRLAPSPSARTLALAGIVALLGAMVQGIGNFNLPVMSNLLYFAVALMLAFRSGVTAAR